MIDISDEWIGRLEASAVEGNDIRSIDGGTWFSVVAARRGI